VTLGDATVTSTGPGIHRAEVTIPTDGVWDAQVSVRVDEFANPVAEVSSTLG
jgi:copper transport protein